MPTLGEIVESIQTGSVRIGTRDITVRALSAAEVGIITQKYTEPAPPMGDDPTKGSKAAAIERPDDPAYLKRRDAWGLDYRAARAAVAMGLSEDGSPEWPAAEKLRTPDGRAQAAKYLEFMVPRVQSSLTAEVLMLVHQKSVELGAGLAAGAEKNSSTPAPTGSA